MYLHTEILLHSEHIGAFGGNIAQIHVCKCIYNILSIYRFFIFPFFVKFARVCWLFKTFFIEYHSVCHNSGCDIDYTTQDLVQTKLNSFAMLPLECTKPSLPNNTSFRSTFKLVHIYRQ